MVDKRILTEATLKAVRSSGPGGQHVNKTSTKVELRFNVDASKFIAPLDKRLIKIRLKNKINVGGELIVTAQESRSQFSNKDTAESRLIEMIDKATQKQKRRIKTRPGKHSIEKRLLEKRRKSEKKSMRYDNNF
ncbi:MAG: aminoacyl-tRNA hydrolase [Bacteroidales bacterium]|nr:aminoacyl-tRNA hydrolase [Bacteroidales bacterium]